MTDESSEDFSQSEIGESKVEVNSPDHESVINISEDKEVPAAEAESTESAEYVKPDYVLDKFETSDDQSRAYAELEKRFSTREIMDPPESYEIPEFEGKDFKFDAESPLLKKLTEQAKELKLSQKDLDGLLEIYADDVTNNPEVYNESKEDIIKNLGEGGEETLNNLGQWVVNSFSGEQAKLIDKFTKSTDNVKLLQMMREKLLNDDISLADSREVIPQGARMTMDEFSKEIQANEEQYLHDPKYRAALQDKVKHLRG